jgi:hypothetical protein
MVVPSGGAVVLWVLTLTAHDKESVTIMCEGEEKVINKKDTVYIKLDDFDL